MLDQFIKIAQLRADALYGVKTANVDWVMNLPQEHFEALPQDVQYFINNLKKKKLDNDLRFAMESRPISSDPNPTNVAETILNRNPLDAKHYVAPGSDGQYIVHQALKGQPIQSYAVDVPKNVYDLPESRAAIHHNVQNQSLKGLGLGAVGGAAIGAGLGHLYNSDQEDDDNNAVLGGALGGTALGALGAAVGGGHGKQIGQNQAVGGYIARQVGKVV